MICVQFVFQLSSKEVDWVERIANIPTQLSLNRDYRIQQRKSQQYKQAVESLRNKNTALRLIHPLKYTMKIAQCRDKLRHPWIKKQTVQENSREAEMGELQVDSVESILSI